MRKWMIALVGTVAVLAVACSGDTSGSRSEPRSSDTPTPEPTALSPQEIEAADNRSFFEVAESFLDSYSINSRSRSSGLIRGGDLALLDTKAKRLRSEWGRVDPSYLFQSCYSRVTDSLKIEGERDAAASGEVQEFSRHLRELWQLAYDECKTAYVSINDGESWPLESQFAALGASVDNPSSVDARFWITPTPTATAIPPPGPGQAVVRVIGSSQGMGFSGSLGEGFNQRSVSAGTPSTYYLASKEGIYIAVIQNEREFGTLTVEIECGGRVVSQTTTAAFGVVSVTCTE